MNIPDEEGLVNHLGLGSCAGNGNGAREALTEVCAGWVWSLAIG
jgi:hypothetical protein